MKARYLMLSLTAVALLPVLAGCGSSAEQATAQATMPLAKYGHKASVICAKRSLEQAQIATLYLEKHPNAKKLDLVIPAGVPPLEKEIEDLRDLGLPRGHEKEMEVFLEEAEKALEEMKEEPKDALGEKTSPTNPFKKANALGVKLRLDDCSGNP